MEIGVGFGAPETRLLNVKVHKVFLHTKTKLVDFVCLWMFRLGPGGEKQQTVLLALICGGPQHGKGTGSPAQRR